MAGDAALEAAQRRPHYGTHTLPSKSARGRSGSGRWVDFSNWDQQLSRWVGTSWGTVPVLLVVLLVVVITFGGGNREAKDLSQVKQRNTTQGQARPAQTLLHSRPWLQCLGSMSVPLCRRQSATAPGLVRATCL